MAYLAEPVESVGNILCCECALPIEPNAANMCVACIRTRVDITEGIPKSAVIYFCRNCERYLQPPTHWISAALESKELLSVCLKKMKGLKLVRLVDAGFVWTEPHSKRIKVKLTIQKEVLSGIVLQQAFVIEFTVTNQMCEDCHRVEAKDFWRAVAQIRQKATHKKTLFYLEQMILKYKAHSQTINIQECPDGIDFFFGQPQDTKKFVDFILSVVPAKYTVSKKLISHDIRNNVHSFKTTYMVDVAPVCKHDVVVLPRKLAQSLGNLAQIVVVLRVTNLIKLIDPSSLQLAELNAGVYWRTPFQSICGPKSLKEYMVMEVELIEERDRSRVAGHGHESSKHLLADVYVMKMSDITSDQQYHCRTHLGHLLKPGDTAMGFDLASSNANNDILDEIATDKRPDIILVKKVFGSRGERKRRRKWRLKRLERDAAMSTSSSMDRDFNDFEDDLEEDPDVRQHINIYKKDAVPGASADADEMGTDDEDYPQISLQEMLDDLHISDNPVPHSEGEPMVE